MDKFVILTYQRTGSTYLKLYLNNHPNIQCDDEIFLSKYKGHDGINYYLNKHNAHFFKNTNKYMNKLGFNIVGNKNVQRFLKDKLNKHDKRIKVYGFKLMYSQLRGYKNLEDFINNEGFKILHLVRRNLIKMYISNIRAKKTKIFHAKEKGFDISPIDINVKKLLKFIKKNIHNQDLVREKFKGLEILEIDYESMFSNQVLFFNNVFKFLNVSSEVKITKPKNIKVSPDALQEQIKNFDQVKKVIDNSPYYFMLK